MPEIETEERAVRQCRPAGSGRRLPLRLNVLRLRPRSYCRCQKWPYRVARNRKQWLIAPLALTTSHQQNQRPASLKTSGSAFRWQVVTLTAADARRARRGPGSRCYYRWLLPGAGAESSSTVIGTTLCVAPLFECQDPYKALLVPVTMIVSV